MYWYPKVKKYAFSVVLLFAGTTALLSCAPEDNRSNSSSNTGYFPIHDFFTAEVSKLKSKNPIVDKTVWKEDKSENQKLRIKNWDVELGNFLSVDLNKPAYEQQFRIDSIADTLRYTALNEKLDIQSVELIFNAAKVPQRIRIRKATNNTLYSNIEELLFEPGIRYVVKKEQTIRLLGKNHYQIEGKIE